MQVELRERSVGELIGLCFTLGMQHMAKLLPIAIICGLPGLFIELVRTSLDPRNPNMAGAVVMLGLAGTLINMLVYSAQQAAFILIVSDSFTGGDHGIADSLRVGLRKLWPVLAYSVATSLIIGIGFLLIIPGLIFITWYYVGTPVIVLEEMGWQEAMARSKELGSGQRMKLLGFAILMGLVVLVPMVAVAGMLGAIIGEEGPLAAFLIWCVQVVFFVFTSAAPVVYYFQLRVVKEALDVQALSSLVSAIEERAQAPAA